MCAVTGDTEGHRFLMGSSSAKRENEVHLIAYSEDTNRIELEGVFSLDNGRSEIWTLQASPYNKEVFACGLHGASDRVGLFDMSAIIEPSKDFDKKALRAKLELGNHTSPVHSIAWEDQEPSEGFLAKELISADGQQALVWDLPSGQLKARLETGEEECTVVKRDPHHKNVIALGVENGFRQIDLRTSQLVNKQAIAHSDLLTDLDYNPNKLNTLATCGRDSVLRFWDLRRADKCLLEFENETHWLMKVKYNRFHD
jgi:WD40 repeat protein